MSRTRKKDLIKKELVTDPIHRKAGPHNIKKPEPKICPDCQGKPMEDWYGRVWECPTCGGEGEVF